MLSESCCLERQRKLGGTFHLKLNTNSSPIANKYREGKVQSTLERELNVLETVVMQAYGTCAWSEDWVCLDESGWDRQLMQSVVVRFKVEDVPLILRRLPTRVSERSNAWSYFCFGKNASVRIVWGLSFVDVSFLCVPGSRSLLSVLVPASCQGPSALAVRFTVLACKVSYDPS